MLQTILSLPHASYFPNLASQLRNFWMKIDANLIKSFDIDELRDELEDVNDLLMYIQDIFNAKLPALTRALSNSLLYFAYLPSLIGSLSAQEKDPDINSYSANIFFLTQTYNYLKEPLFINALSIALFISHIPMTYEKLIHGPTKVPRSFRRNYVTKPSYSSLARYTEENISVVNFESFIYANYGFMGEIVDEYATYLRIKEANDQHVEEDPKVDQRENALFGKTHFSLFV